MLSQFFNCQWLEESNFDWTRQVKMDLADSNLHTDLNWIRKKSVFSWKQAGAELCQAHIKLG